MTRRQLPIGIQDFRTIREQGFYYVDKTPHIRQLVDRDGIIFCPDRAGSGKAFWSIPYGNCLRAMSPCSGALISTTTGTGRSGIRWCG